MTVIIQASSPKPIYTQIEDQIRDQVLSLALTEGEALPSIRKLAQDIQVSVITVKRAYDDLEAEGIVQTVAGKGTFVAVRNQTLFRERKLREIENALQSAIDLAARSRISGDEIRALFEILMTEVNHGTGDQRNGSFEKIQ